MPVQKGTIVTDEGKVIGEHQGLMYYTIGQRQGIGIGGVKNSAEAPWFVVSKDLVNNRLVIGQGHEHPLMMSRSLYSEKLDWVAGECPTLPLRCKAKTRYRQPDQDCVIYSEGKGIRVIFDEPQRAVTAGQSAVFYSGDVCLGGGVIESTQLWTEVT